MFKRIALAAFVGVALTGTAQAATPTFTVADTIVRETDGRALVMIRKTGDNGKPSRINYYTLDGDAASNEGISPDYVPTSGTITFDANQKTALIEIPILDDKLDEVNEYFKLFLSGLVNANADDSKFAKITIIDDDPDVSPNHHH